MRFAIGLGVLLAVAHPAYADDEKHDDDKFFLVLGGIDLGAALHEGATGGLLGAEVSVPYFGARGFWGGLYTDAAYDTANSATRFSIGPEFGWMYFGVDGGFVHQFGGDGPEGGSRNGIAVRPCLTIAYATVYFRHVEMLDDQPGSSLNEVGLLLKYPLYDITKRAGFWAHW